MRILLKVILILVLVVILSTTAAVLIFYYSPGLQKKIVQGALDSNVEGTATVETVRFRLHGTEIRGLEVRAGEEGLRLQSMVVKVSVPSLFGDRPVIESFVMEGLEVNVSNGGSDLMTAFSKKSPPIQAGESQPRAPAAAPLTKLPGLPIDIHDLAIEGIIHLPDNQRLDLTLSATDLVLGEAGTLSLAVNLKESLSKGPPKEISVNFEGSLAQDMEGMIQNLNLAGSIDIREFRPPNYSGAALSLSMSPILKLEDEDKRLLFSTPVRLTGPSGSPTNGSFTVSLSGIDSPLIQFDADLDVEEIRVDEWQPLVDSFSRDETTAEPDRDPDTAPPWSRLDGILRAQIGRLVMGQNTFSGIGAVVQVENGQTLTAQLDADSGGSPISLKAGVRFDETRADEPYSLEGNLAVKGLDVEPFLRTQNSRQPVLLEGIFNVDGQFQSEAPNLALFVEKLTGEMTLEAASDGVFRPLGENTAVASGVSGLLGALTGSVKELDWVREVVNQLKEIPYSEMRFQMEREASLDWRLHDLDLVSRETRIKGSGLIEHEASMDFMRMPIDLEFQLFAKGRLAEALRAGNQLRSREPDAKGFYPGPPLPIRGSLAQPKSLFVNTLMDSGKSLLPGLLD